MNVTLIKTIWIVWVPVVVLLFRVIEPRRAVLVAVIGGLLFLPADHLQVGLPWFTFHIDKWIMTGFGLALGVLCFDRQALSRVRPQWLDLPMVLYALCPLIGLTRGSEGSTADIVDEVNMRAIGWFMPYAMGRIYFGQADGPARVGIALTTAGLAYIPFCLYEEYAGPSRYLAVLMYGTSYKVGAVDRLGGWRPEVFLGNGHAVSSWMALVTVTATWLWLGKTWRLRGWPAFIPPLALLATTLSCRGVYAYVTLAIGLLTVVLTRLFRTRIFLILILIASVTYMVLRISNLWDGGFLVEGAGLMGKASTVGVRLESENEIVHKVLSRSPIFGMGTNVYHSPVKVWPDSLWLQALWMNGLVGLAIHMGAIFALPALLGLSKPRGRPDSREAASPTWALACWCLLQMIEGMHNSNNFTPTALIVGTLVGSFQAKDTVGRHFRPKDWSFEPTRPTLSVPLLIAVIILLGIEFIGRLPRVPIPVR